MTLRKVLVAAATTLTILGPAASQASASVGTFWEGDITSGQNKGGGWYGNVTKVEAYAPSGHATYVGALQTNGSLYGGWVSYNSARTCVTYPYLVARPYAGNNYSGTMKVYGYVGVSGSTC